MPRKYEGWLAIIKRRASEQIGEEVEIDLPPSLLRKAFDAGVGPTAVADILAGQRGIGDRSGGLDARIEALAALQMPATKDGDPSPSQENAIRAMEETEAS